MPEPSQQEPPPPEPSGSTHSGTSGGEDDLDLRFLPPVVALVLLLAATSGIVDAVAYQRFGVFVANQTGNLVVVAVSATTGSGGNLTTGLSLVALVSFVVGVFAAMWLRTLLRVRLSVSQVRVLLLGIEALLIALVGVAVLIAGETATAYLAVALLSASQAMHAVVITRVVGVAIQTVVINTALVQSATWWFGGRRRAALVAFSTPVGYLVGAALGSTLTRFPPPTALASALVTATASALVAQGIRSRGAPID